MCREDLERVLGRGCLNWGNQNEGFIRETIWYDFLTVQMTVESAQRVRNSGIHVVVDYVSLNDFYEGSLTGFSPIGDALQPFSIF